jgi:hypothetical protein
LFALLFILTVVWLVVALIVQWFAEALGADGETSELLGVSVGVLAALAYTFQWAKWRRRREQRPRAR